MDGLCSPVLPTSSGKACKNRAYQARNSSNGHVLSAENRIIPNNFVQFPTLP